jgi:hypothetical protein
MQRVLVGASVALALAFGSFQWSQAQGVPSTDDRVTALEARVRRLEQQLAATPVAPVPQPHTSVCTAVLGQDVHCE